MKLLYLCADPGIPVYGTKGASVHVRALLAALRRADHHVTLVAPVLTRHESDETEPVAATVRHLPVDAAIKSTTARLRAAEALVDAPSPIANEVRRALYSQLAIETLTPELDADPPDAIYERLSLMGVAGAELARRLDVPLIVEVNSPLSLETASYRRLHLDALAARSEQHVLESAAAVLAVSAAVRDHVVSVGARPDRTHVVPNAIDPDLFFPRAHDPELRAGLGAGDGDVIIGFVGGLRPWHGVEALPDFLHAILRQGHRARLAIVGDGPLREPLSRAFTVRGIDDHVHMTGAVDHHRVAEITAQLDIALAPYPDLDHAFYFSPLKLFEYMGSGVATVASRIGQIAEVVEDGVTGLLTPPGDTPALVDACTRLIADPGLRGALGRAASAHVHRDFTWDRNAARVAELVDALSASPA